MVILLAFYFQSLGYLIDIVSIKSVTVLGQRHLPYSTTLLIGPPTTSALVAGSIYLFTSILATPFPFP